MTNSTRIAAMVIAIVENYVQPPLRRSAADAITDLLVEVQRDMTSAAVQAMREGVKQAAMEAKHDSN